MFDDYDVNLKVFLNGKPVRASLGIDVIRTRTSDIKRWSDRLHELGYKVNVVQEYINFNHKEQTVNWQINLSD